MASNIDDTFILIILFSTANFQARHVFAGQFLGITVLIIASTLDPINKARNVEGIGHYAPGDTEVIVSNENDISYVLGLVAQSYQIN